MLVPASVMLVTGLWGLNRGSVWQDEEATLDAARRPLPQLWLLVQHTDAVHAVYYLLMHAWLLHGGGEVWARVPSVLATAVSAGLVAAIGVRLVGTRAGLLAGLLFTTLPFVSFYAQEARSYALVSAAVLAATYCLVGASRRTSARGSAGPWVGYGVALLAAGLLNELALLVVPAHGLALLLTRQSRPVGVRWMAVVATVAALMAPLLWLSRGQTAQVAWIPPVTWSTLPRTMVTFAGPSASASWVLLVLALVAVAAGVTARGALGALAAYAGPLLVVPVGLLALASLAHPLFVDRYVLFAVPGLALLAGTGLDRVLDVLPTRPALVGAAVVLVALTLLELPEQQRVRTVVSRDDDLAAAAQVVQDGARPGDGVLFMPSDYRAAELAYPQAFASVRDLSLGEAPGPSGTLRGVDTDPLTTVRAMLAAPRIWVVGRRDLLIRANEVGARIEQHALTRAFHLVRRVPVHGMQVALYVRDPRPHGRPSTARQQPGTDRTAFASGALTDFWLGRLRVQ